MDCVLYIFIWFLFPIRYRDKSIEYAKDCWTWASAKWWSAIHWTWKKSNRNCRAGSRNAGKFGGIVICLLDLHYKHHFRNHALAKHADILTCIETRISMLSMTYTKYIELNLCCFIPGKIIDEVLQILRLVGTTLRPLRAHEVLQELRDISSMAIDHFDEQIAPNLKKSFCEISSQKMGSSLYQSTRLLILHKLCGSIYELYIYI